MRAIKTIDRNAIKYLREQMNKALESVAKKHNLNIEVGNASFDINGTNASFKISIATKGKDGEVNTKEAVAFKTNAGLYGFKPTDLGRTFEYRGETYRISGLSTRSRKCPIIVDRVQDHKTFVFTSEFVKASLGEW